MRAPTHHSLLFAFGVALTAACSSGSSEPSGSTSLSIAGTWDLVGFSDAGVAAVTTGTWISRVDGTFGVAGTVTYPDEPTDSLVIDGTYVQTGTSVALTVDAETTNWKVAGSSNQVTLTLSGPPPANTITLRRP
jgi:hypothetical protein